MKILRIVLIWSILAVALLPKVSDAAREVTFTQFFYNSFVKTFDAGQFVIPRNIDLDFLSLRINPIVWGALAVPASALNEIAEENFARPIMALGETLFNRSTLAELNRKLSLGLVDEFFEDDGYPKLDHIIAMTLKAFEEVARIGFDAAGEDGAVINVLFGYRLLAKGTDWILRRNLESNTHFSTFDELRAVYSLCLMLDAVSSQFSINSIEEFLSHENNGGFAREKINLAIANGTGGPKGLDIAETFAIVDRLLINKYTQKGEFLMRSMDYDLLKNLVTALSNAKERLGLMSTDERKAFEQNPLLYFQELEGKIMRTPLTTINGAYLDRF